MGIKRFISRTLGTLLPVVRRPPPERMPTSLYRYIWRISGRHQLGFCVLTLLIFPLTLAPLELQRRIVNDAIGGRDLNLLLQFGALYLAATLIRSGLKFLRNAYMDRVAEGVIRLLRSQAAQPGGLEADAEDGTRQTIVATESEKIGGFVAGAIATPLLQLGTLLSVAGYMLLVDPLIALVALLFLLPSLVIVGITQPTLNRLAELKISTGRELGQALVPVPEAGATDNLIDHMYRLRLRFTLIKHAAKQTNNLINQLGPLSVLMVGGWLVINGRAELGTLVAFMSGYERMTAPVRDLLNFYRQQALMRVQYRLVQKASLPVEQKA